MRSGRFTTFHHLYKATKDTSFFVLDVNSLYPERALSNNFPAGKLEIITDPKIISQIIFDQGDQCHYLLPSKTKMIGIAKVRILAPPTMKEAFLGCYNKEGNYVYGLCRACINAKNEKNCRHGVQSKAITDLLCWNEINFAVSLGYSLLNIFECYQYPKEIPLFKKFIQILSREKIKHTETDPKIDLEEYAKIINTGMKYGPKLTLDKSDFISDSRKKQYFKDFLNGIIGSICSQKRKMSSILVKSQSHLDSIKFKDIENVFPLEKACLLMVKKNSFSSKMSLTTNSIIYSYVLAYSRIFMFKALLELWKQNAIVYLISNDAIYFSQKQFKKIPLEIGPLFGQFKNEYPNCKILSFYSFGSKSCCITYKNANGLIIQKIKARGFFLSSCICKNITDLFDFETALKKALVRNKSSICLPQIRHTHSLKELSTRENLLLCQFSCDIKKVRIIMEDGSSKCYGSLL